MHTGYTKVTNLFTLVKYMDHGMKHDHVYKDLGVRCIEKEQTNKT